MANWITAVFAALFVYYASTPLPESKPEPEPVRESTYEYNWCELPDDVYDEFWRVGADACEIITFDV